MPNCANCGRPLPSVTFGEASNLCPECRAAAAQAAPRPVARPRPPVTTALVVVNVAVFVAMGLSGASWTSPNTEQLLRWGANFGPLTLGAQPWRALTANYVHIGIIHILFNMWCLWDLGQLSERIFGRWTYLLVYTFSGLAGSLASLWWRPMSVGAGASGAIFGLAGALITALYLGKLPFPKQAMQRTLRSLLTFAGYNLFFGAVAAGIDNSAHIGGLLSGAAMGACLAGTLTVDADSRSQKQKLVLAGAVLALVAGAGFVSRTNHYVVLLRRADDALMHGQPQAALPDLQKLAQQRPNDVQVHTLLGNAYSQIKDYPRAEASLRRALNLSPGNEGAQYNLGLLYLQTSRYQEALSVFSPLHDRNPKDADLDVLVGESLSGLKRYDEAMDSYRRGLANDPRSASAYLGMGKTQLAMGDSDAALASLKQAAVLDASDSDIQTELSKAYAAKGMKQESEAAAQKAAELEKASPANP